MAALEREDAAAWPGMVEQYRESLEMLTGAADRLRPPSTAATATLTSMSACFPGSPMTMLAAATMAYSAGQQAA